MKINHKSVANGIIWFSVFVYYSSLDIVAAILPGGNGRYVLLAALLLMLGGYLIKNQMTVKLRFTPYHWYILIFALYTLLTSMWAIEPEFPLSWGTDFFGVFVMMTIVYLCCQDQESVGGLLKVIMWGGFFVIIYAIVYYGHTYFLYVLSVSERVSNELINANILGMNAAYSILLYVYFLMYKKAGIWCFPLSIVSLVVLLASGSRKALIILLVGVFMLFIMRNIDNKKIINSFAKIVLTVVLLFIAVWVFSQIPVFSGINQRMEGLINGLIGKGSVDGSTSIRFKLVELGKEIFSGSPLFGIGMDNAKIIALSRFNRKDFYLHNNYIEILADGGIVGIISYYWIYAVILRRMIKYRDFKNPEFNICFTLFIITLIMDYGMVSYLEKSTYFRLMIFYMCTKKLRESHSDTEKKCMGGRSSIWI